MRLESHFLILPVVSGMILIAVVMMPPRGKPALQTDKAGPQRTVHAPHGVSSPARGIPATGPEILEILLACPPDDAPGFFQHAGRAANLPDAEIEAAWNDLLRREPRNNLTGGLICDFFYQRMRILKPGVTRPEGWTATTTPPSEDITPDQLESIGKRLRNGETLDGKLRFMYFNVAIRKNPIEALSLWCVTTAPDDYEAEGTWFESLMTDPQSRSAVVGELVRNGRGSLVAHLLGGWMKQDPAAVHDWLDTPEMAGLKDELGGYLSQLQARIDPAGAWTTSARLPADRRREIRATTARILAMENPDLGGSLISELGNSAEKAEVIPAFSAALAERDFSKWRAWRDSLPDALRNKVNALEFPAWIRNDPEQASLWLASQPESEARNHMITEVVSHCSMSDPDLAAQWIKAIPDSQQRLIAISRALRNLEADDADAIREILSARP